MESYLSFMLNSLIFFPLSFLRQMSTRQRCAIYHRLSFIISPSPNTSLNFWKRSLYSYRYFLQYSRKFIVSSISTPNLERVCLRLSSSISHSLVYSMLPSSLFAPIASYRQKPYLLPQGVLKFVLQNFIEKYLLPYTLLPSSCCFPFSSTFLRMVQLSGIVAMKTPPTSRFERIAASPLVRAFSELNMQWKQSWAETMSQQECCISQQKDWWVKSCVRVKRRQGSWLFLHRSSQLRMHSSLKSTATIYCNLVSFHLGISCPLPQPISRTCSILLQDPIFRSSSFSISRHVCFVCVWMSTALIQLLNDFSSNVSFVSRCSLFTFISAIWSQFCWICPFGFSSILQNIYTRSSPLQIIEELSC